ncbi:hypothetical protein STAS_08720, partial [Striga asiatica]
MGAILKSLKRKKCSKWTISHWWQQGLKTARKRKTNSIDFSSRFPEGLTWNPSRSESHHGQPAESSCRCGIPLHDPTNQTHSCKDRCTMTFDLDRRFDMLYAYKRQDPSLPNADVQTLDTHIQGSNNISNQSPSVSPRHSDHGTP